MSLYSSLGDRMKGYENISRTYLAGRMPVIIRVDGKAFHTFTRGMEKPFDQRLINAMWETAVYLTANIMGCKVAYVQSDEISLLLTDYDSLTTQAWFDKNIQKMVSVSASMATLAFNKAFANVVEMFEMDTTRPDYNRLMQKYKSCLNTALFDSRVFVIPKEEVTNYFIWRQQDATRNAIEMVAHINFSNKQLHKVTCSQIQEMLWKEKGINFNDFPVYFKRGACVFKESYTKEDMPTVKRTRWVVDKNIPIFTQDREYIERFVNPLCDIKKEDEPNV